MMLERDALVIWLKLGPKMCPPSQYQMAANPALLAQSMAKTREAYLSQMTVRRRKQSRIMQQALIFLLHNPSFFKVLSAF
jgi:hypothetical protein